MKKINILIFLFLVPAIASGQTVWSLEDCIAYAITHNLSIQKSQTSIQEQQTRLKMAKNERLPNVSGSLSPNMYFGRGPSRDGTYIDNNQASVNAGISLNMLVFNGGRVWHDIAYNQLNLLASEQDTQSQIRNIKIQIIAQYMQVLFDKEICNVAEQQVKISEQQVEKAKLLLAADRNTTMDLTEKESLLANDRLHLSESKQNLALSRMELMQLLYLEDQEGFEVSAPLSDAVGQHFNAPLSVYLNEGTIEATPDILAAKYRLESSYKSIQASKAALFPSISLTAGYANSYYYSFVDGYNNKAFATQLRNNGNQYIGLNVSIPIFRGSSQSNQVKLARINTRNLEIQKKEITQTVKNDIEKAYLNVYTARDKYDCAKTSLKYAKEVFANEETKYNLGKSTFFNYNEAKKNFLSAQSTLLQAKYEYAFKITLLNVYAGLPVEF